MSKPPNSLNAQTTEEPTDHFAAKQDERRSQVRGSLMLAAAVLAFALVRAIAHDGLHRVFSVGWWRIW